MAVVHGHLDILPNALLLAGWVVGNLAQLNRPRYPWLVCGERL
jgi:hypothetical protein